MGFSGGNGSEVGLGAGGRAQGDAHLAGAWRYGG